MSEPTTSVLTAIETATDVSYKNGCSFLLDKMDSYPVWTFCMECELEDAKYAWTIATVGQPTGTIARRLLLSHIGDEIEVPLIIESLQAKQCLRGTSRSGWASDTMYTTDYTIKILKELLSSCRLQASLQVFVEVMGSTNCQIKSQLLVIQY